MLFFKKRSIKAFFNSCYRTRRRRVTSTLFLVAFCTFLLAGCTKFHSELDTEDLKYRYISKRDTSHLCSPVQTERSAPAALCIKPNITVEPRKDTFQLAGKTEIYIYSAYYDPRITGHFNVRIIGIAPVEDHKVFCLMMMHNKHYYSVPATVILTSVDLVLHANFRYKPYIFVCNISSSWGVPRTVSMTSHHCSEPNNMLPVTALSALPDTQMPNKLSVCLRTIHKLKSPYSIIEFMELQHTLGVHHVYIYGVEEVSPEVQKTLDYYSNLKSLTVVPWKLPVKNSAVFEDPGEIAIHGQHALNNDCVYRSMNDYRLIFMHDMDEFIISRNPKINTHMELVNFLDSRYNKSGKPVASYYFTNCYFCLKPGDYEGPKLFTIDRVTRHECQKKEMEKAWRENPNQKHLEGDRKAAKKTLVYPRRVLEFGVHGIIKLMPGYEKELKTPPFDAQMHHYKKPQDITCSIEDNMLRNKYASGLKQKVNKVCKKLELPEVP